MSDSDDSFGDSSDTENPYNLDRKRKYKRGTEKSAWTVKEHGRFVEGLSLFQRDWLAVASHVGTRDRTQVTSHAQKHFNRCVLCSAGRGHSSTNRAEPTACGLDVAFI